MLDQGHVPKKHAAVEEARSHRSHPSRGGAHRRGHWRFALSWRLSWRDGIPGPKKRRNPKNRRSPAESSSALASTQCSSAAPKALAPKSSAPAPTQCSSSSKILIDDFAHSAKHVATKELVTWLYAIVLGRQIRVSDATHKFKTILRSGLSIKVTKKFELKHKTLWKTIKSLASIPGSTMTLARGEEQGISTKHGLVHWLMVNRCED